MRLSESEIASITGLAKKHFGEDVQVILFGSRVDDDQRGGDIDLFVRKLTGERLTVLAKVRFMTDLMFRIGEQKVDVVLDRPERRNSLFFKTIQEKGVALC